MIVFELICPGHHRFEGWFASASEFEGQKSRGLLSCPVCSNSEIEKLLTAKIAKGEAEPAPVQAKPVPVKASPPQNLQQLVDYVLVNSENVGKEFPAEARRIHNDEAPQRNIRGLATVEETRELLEEGIAVLPLPLPPTTEWH